MIVLVAVLQHTIDHCSCASSFDYCSFCDSKIIDTGDDANTSVAPSLVVEEEEEVWVVLVSFEVKAINDSIK